MSTAKPESAREVLSQVPGTLRALVEENQKLAGELDGFRKRAMAEEIVREMDNRGLVDPHVPFADKVGALLESEKDLQVVKEAMSMATSNFSFVSVVDSEDDTSDAAFENFILGSS